MDNLTPTPVQNPAQVAPATTPAMVAAAPVVQALPKPSHKRLYILLAVFAVMGGALAAVGVMKPDLVTSTIAWVTNTPMHAASSESLVLVNGKWVSTSNPDAALAKSALEKAKEVYVPKPASPAEVKTSIEVLPAVDAPVVEATDPMAPAEGSPAAVVAPVADDKAVAPEGAFDLNAVAK